MKERPNIGLNMRRNASTVAALLCILTFWIPLPFAVGQSIPDPTLQQKGSPYFDNPFEASAEVTKQEKQTEDANLPIEVTDSNKAITLKQLLNSRIYNDVFLSELPSLLTEGQWRLRLSPKLGDFFGDEYIRLRIGASYNFSDYFEASVETGSYFPNPFDDASRAGFSDIKLGAKYSWWNLKESGYNLSLSYTAQVPFSNPPLELFDGYARYQPSISISKEISENPAILSYLNITYEFIGESPFETAPEIPIPRNRLFLRPGIIYYPGGNYRYEFEVEYRTNTINSVRPQAYIYSDTDDIAARILAFESLHEFYLSPTVTWFPTEKTRKGMVIPGNWDVSVRLQIPVAGETQDNLEVSMKFNWYFDYESYLKNQFERLSKWNLLK